MPIDRREFVAAVTSLATTAAARPSGLLATLGTADDPLGVRDDFPILRNGRTFLNSAYITPSPRSVVAAGQAFLQAKAERPLSVGELLGKANDVRAQFARLVNATPDEIGFVFATTEAENIVASNVPMMPGDNVVVDDLHYEGALVVHREFEKRRGTELRIVRHRNGVVTPDDIARHVDHRTRLISVSLVSSINGFRHDIRALAELAHRHGGLLHVDAIQALGMFPVDVRATDVDFMCAGTYKGLLAGFGGAPFYIKGSLLERVAPDRFGVFQIVSQTPDLHFTLRTTARRHDYATLPFAEIHQLGASLSYLERVGVTRIEAHTLELTRRLKEGLVRQGYKLFTSIENRSPVTAFHYARPMAEVRAALDAAKIDVTVRDGHVRVSVALFNNAEDVDRLLTVTQRLS